MNRESLIRLYSIWHPEMYHGFGHKQGFFQGWYFKLVDASEKHALAVIPGVFLGCRGQHSHAFVQVLTSGRLGKGQAGVAGTARTHWRYSRRRLIVFKSRLARTTSP